MEHTFGLDWDDIPESLTAVAAKPKGNRAPDEPTQQPMRPVQQIRNSPSADQLKARKQMSRKQAADDRSTHYDEAGEPIQQWICSHCEHRNDNDTDICEQCGAPDDDMAFHTGSTKARKQMSRKQASGTTIHCDDCDFTATDSETDSRGARTTAQQYAVQHAKETGHTWSADTTKESRRKQAADISREYDLYRAEVDPKMTNSPSSGPTCNTCGAKATWYVMGPHSGDWADYYCDEHKNNPFGTNAIFEKVATHKESAMRTEAQILREMAVASLADQRTLAEELDSVRRTRTASIQADRDVDLADTVVRAHLTPVRVHAMHTTATDWVDTEEPQGDPTLAMKTEATLWFQRTSAEVREDADEFATQATGMATRLASRHGEQADAAFEAFIGHVDHLYRQAAKVALEADPSGQAQSNLPEPDDEDPYLSEDWDDDDTGVHPPMPGAGEKTSSVTAGTAPGDSPADDFQDKMKTKDVGSCTVCGDSIAQDPAGEDPRTWHHDNGEKHDHEASPGNKTSSLTAEAGEKVDEDDPATGVTGLPEPDDTEPYLAEDWQGDPPVPSGAADVKNADNPFDNSKSSMLDKAAAFRALVQSNLEK